MSSSEPVMKEAEGIFHMMAQRRRVHGREPAGGNHE